ncbi:MAG: hypothetical protein WCS03_00065 [Bacteroidota bacterium]
MDIKTIVLLNIFLFDTLASGFSQFVIQPNYALKSHETLEISKVEITPERTLFFLSIENRIEGGTFCADRNIWLIDSDGQRTKLEKASGIPVCPESYQFKSIGEKLQFTLVFPPLKTGTRWVDLIEDCTENCFSFYGVTLNAGLNTKINEALSLAESGRKSSALVLYKNILESLDASDKGIKGALYNDIITLSLETGDKTGAREWYKKMLLSDVPRLELYVKNLNSRGIKY